MENDDEFIRKFDNTINDNLISSNIPSDLSQNFVAFDPNDQELNMAIEESIKLYEMEKIYGEQLKKLEEEKKIKELKIQEKENIRVEELKLKLGIVISRLKNYFKDDDVAKDLLKWIEWECTPIHLLKSFRPNTKFSIIEIKEWIKKNLNNKMIELLESTSFY